MPGVSDADFVAAWNKAGGSPVLVARMLGIKERGVYARRERMEKRGVVLSTVPSAPGGTHCYPAPARNYEQRAKVELRDGVAVVFSDAHWWPGVPLTVAHGALLRLLRTIKPT